MNLLFQSPRARVGRAVRRLTGAASPLHGRTVLVTGASSGIGEATARAVARRHARVILVARRAEELARVRDGIEAEGGTAWCHACDLTDGDAVDELVKQVLVDHGTVDYLVNNAGRSIRRSLELSYDRFHDFERTMAVNYFGPVRLTMGLLGPMRAQKFGHVVNIVTWGNQIKSPKFAAYIASKSALEVFGRIAGRETFFDNVTFSNVRVTLVRTDMIGPTEVYRNQRAHSPEQTAELVVRALEDRPITVSGLTSTLLELQNLFAPRWSDFVFAVAHRQVPDSKAARASATEPPPQL